LNDNSLALCMVFGHTVSAGVPFFLSMLDNV